MLLRNISTMANPVKSSPFSKAVFSAVRKLYPEELADKSFDNTGVLLEAPYNGRSKRKNSILLAIDLTTAVAQEAIDKKTSVIVAYHPIIFHGLKHLNLDNSQQTSLLRLAAEGVSVYCPHTAVDAAEGGNADWMADIITSQFTSNSQNADSHVTDAAIEKVGSYSLFDFPRQTSTNGNLKLSSYKHIRKVVQPNAVYPSAGIGRIVEFEAARSLADIVSAITTYFNKPRAFTIAPAYGKSINDITISSVGICAGSGASVVGSLSDIDLIITGEISHHEALAAVESGKTVIAFGHSNSERGYLAAVMKDKLNALLTEEWATIRAEHSRSQSSQANKESADEVFEDTDVQVEISTRDRDPFAMLVFDP